MKQLLTFILFCIAGMNATAQVTSFQIDSAKFNKPLMVILDSLYKTDQNSRYEYLDAVKNKASKVTVDSLLAIMHQRDQQNLEKAKEIISRYGWVSPQKVGMNASQALFLIIQHADLKTQEEYLPMIRTAEKKGEILSSNLALLEDRINMRNGKKQVYGSQGFTDQQTGAKYFYPIANPDQLDERRKAMGLLPMQEYAKIMNIEWNLESYKAMLPEIEKVAARQKQ